MLELSGRGSGVSVLHVCFMYASSYKRSMTLVSMFWTR